MKKQLRIIFVLFGLLSIFMISGCSKEKKEDKLVMAIMSSESSDETETTWFDDLSNYIEEKVGIPLEIYEVGSYEAGIEALRTGKADINLFSAFSYYLANQRADIEPIASVTVEGLSDLGNSLIVTRADSDISTIQDLKGRSFAFVDPASTSGHIAPKYFLTKEFDVSVQELERDIFSQIAFAGGHDSSIIGVINGQYDAGSCVKLLVSRLTDAGIINEKDFKVIAETSLEGGNAALVIRKEISDTLKKQLAEAFISYDNPSFFKSFLNSEDVRFCEVDYDGLKSIEDVITTLELDAELLMQ